MKNNLINYVNESGELILTAKVDSFQIRSEDDLDLLLSRNYGPGTEAYLYDDSKRWRLGADMQWHLLQNGNGSSSDEGSSSDSRGDIFVATFTEQYDENTNDNIFTCDRTVDEILAAQADGKLIVGQIGGIALTFSGIYRTSIYFVSLDVDITDNTFSVTYIDWDNQQNRWRSVWNNYTLTLKN